MSCARDCTNYEFFMKHLSCNSVLHIYIFSPFQKVCVIHLADDYSLCFTEMRKRGSSLLRNVHWRGPRPWRWIVSISASVPLFVSVVLYLWQCTLAKWILELLKTRIAVNVLTQCLQWHKNMFRPKAFYFAQSENLGNLEAPSLNSIPLFCSRRKVLSQWNPILMRT